MSLHNCSSVCPGLAESNQVIQIMQEMLKKKKLLERNPAEPLLKSSCRLFFVPHMCWCRSMKRNEVIKLEQAWFCPVRLLVKSGKCYKKKKWHGSQRARRWERNWADHENAETKFDNGSTKGMKFMSVWRIEQTVSHLLSNQLEVWLKQVDRTGPARQMWTQQEASDRLTSSTLWMSATL